jgi:hypothetical protein
LVKANLYGGRKTERVVVVDYHVVYSVLIVEVRYAVEEVFDGVPE